MKSDYDKKNSIVGLSFTEKDEQAGGVQFSSLLPQKVNQDHDEGKKGTVSLRQVLRYADWKDKGLMTAGFIFASIHGALYILIMLVFGAQMDVFINFDRGNNYLDQFNDIWRKEGIGRRDIWNSKTIIDVLGEKYNRTCTANAPNAIRRCMNSTLLPEFDQGSILEEMKIYTYWYIAFGVGVLIFAFGQITFFILSAERQVRRIRTTFLKAVLRQDISWYDRLGSGELNTRLSDDMQKIIDGLGDKMGTCVQLVACFIIAFVQGFIIGWKLALVMLGVVPALVAAALVASKLNAALTQKELKAYAKAGKVAKEVLGAIRTVYAFNGEEKESERYNNNLLEAFRRGVRKGFILGAGMGISWFVLYCCYALGFWYGGKLIREEPENYSPGRLLIVFFSVVTGSIAIGQSGPNMQAISTARGAAYTIFNIIDRTPEIDSFAEEGISPEDFQGNIEFNDVVFRYPTRLDVPVLNGLNLTVKVGQTVALVGSSGCGKSTTVSLLQRFYDILQGQILIDGIDIKNYNLKFLRENIGIVAQEPVLFGTTIAENIRYGSEGVKMEEIIQATKEANAFNFISQLPDKFDTMVGERGAHLSGGQKQRIAIARALVRNPKVLLLDEATSALDTESEATVQAALDKASRGRTTIVIAHRLSTVRNADVICGFDGGVVVERGSHDELMKEDGIYYQLVTLQTREMAAMLDDEEDKKPMDNNIVVSADDVEFTNNAIEESFSTKLHSSKDDLRGSFRAIKRIASPTGAARVSVDEDYQLALATQPEETEVAPAELKRVIRLNSEEWPFIVIGCMASLINGAENPVFAIVFTLLLNIFSYLDPVRQERDVSRYAFVFLGIGVIILCSQFFQYLMFAKSGEGLTIRLRRNAFKSMLRQEMAWFDDHRNNVGALCTRLATDSSNVQGATGSRLGLIIQNLANVLVGLTLAFVIGWKLALVMFAFLPLIAGTGAIEARILTGVAAKDKKELEKAGKIALEAIENIRTVASLTREIKFQEMYYNALEKPFRNAQRKAYIFGVAFAVSQSLIYFCFGTAFLFGAFLIQQGEMSFNQVFMVISVVVFGALGVGQTVAFAPDFSKATVAAGRLFHLFDRQPAISREDNPDSVVPDYSGNVRMENVYFRYPTRPESAVLRGLNLNVEVGKTLALVGSSGCGKSTTVSLVERFYDALRGDVLLDGHNIKDLSLSWVRHQIGIVSQEPVLFDRSIAENIAYGDNSREVSMEEVIAAAKKSNIHNFISSLPLAYDTRVGDKGTQLSGGQKQRVAIARALVRNPKILLLDEATSALDTESEKIVQEALDNARAGRTSIVIAHRLSTIQDADHIVVFSNGKIVEQGTHSQLLDLGGIYFGLHEVQNRKKNV